MVLAFPPPLTKPPIYSLKFRKLSLRRLKKWLRGPFPETMSLIDNANVLNAGRTQVDEGSLLQPMV
jgi:hypothetical protein